MNPVSESSSSLELKQLITQNHPELSATVVDGTLRFYDHILRENQKQNLTRLVTPADFYYANIVDILELLSSPWITYPALDLGSGVGIPGILAVLIQPQNWVLAESEGLKAEYLRRMVATLDLTTHISVFNGRAEEFLKVNSVGSIVARAVGPLSRIYAWIRTCSTWNKLILLKGPKWEQEWADFQKSAWRKELKVDFIHRYTAGPGKKQRLIVILSRVPRGTIQK